MPWNTEVFGNFFFTLVLKLHVVCFKFVDSFCKVTKISAIYNSEEETVFS